MITMTTPATPQLTKVSALEVSRYQAIFRQFEHFSNYVAFGFEFLTPELWVNRANDPTLACLYITPAYFLWGDPDCQDVTALFQLLSPDCWIVPTHGKWDRHLTAYFGDKLTTLPRASFTSASLNLAHLRSLKCELPVGLTIVPVDAAHVNDLEGMLYEDLLSKYFTRVDFLQEGAGFCLMEDEKIIGFAVANYPIRNRVLEVYIRVDYNYDPIHRQKGLGTRLGAALLEYCLENGLDPQWDAANEASVRLALKLGYTLHHRWNMYHYQR